MELTDTVREYLQIKSEHLASTFRVEMLLKFETGGMFFNEIESPIEQIFFIEWNYWIRGPFCNCTQFNLYPQFQDKTTGQYKIDFAVGFFPALLLAARHSFLLEQIITLEKKPPTPKLGIELDGHIWHEKTPEQVQYHKERERFLVKNGWKILRYTGREILNDPGKCFFEVFNTAENLKKEYLEQIKIITPERKKRKNEKTKD